MFLPVLRGKLMRLFISGNWRKCWKSLSLNFGGKSSKVLRVHNSKQITEETNPDQWYFFFVCFKEGTEVFTKMRLNDRINWLDGRIPVNFNKLNWHLCSISKKHSLYKVLCYLTSRGKQQRKNHLYCWCVKRMLRFDTNNINEEGTLKM